MKRIFSVFLAVVLILSFASQTMSTELPVPLAGYSWVNCPETKSAFLKPDGWFFKKEKKNDTWAYFITKEDIDKEGEFITGLTVNVWPNIPKKTGMSPSQYAEAFISNFVKKKEVVKQPWSKENGPFKMFGIFVLNKDPQGDFITHNLAIGNDATGTLYMIIYESPASSWGSMFFLVEN